MAKSTKGNDDQTSDKVMREGKPREAVRKISRPPSADDDKDAAKVAAAAEVSDATEDDTTSKGSKGDTATTADGKAKADDGKPAPKRTSKRVTPKSRPAASTRYTPPAPRYEDLPSPTWVPVLMFTLFALGMLTIFFNYVALVLPGATSNWYLLLGLGFILGGIITATQYR